MRHLSAPSSIAFYAILLALTACSSDEGSPANSGAASAGAAGLGGSAASGATGGSSNGGSSGSTTGGSNSGGSAGSAAQAGEGGSATGGSSSGQLPCEVESLLIDRCQTCHSNPTKFGAPMPLVTLADLVAPAVTDSTKTVGGLCVDRMNDPAKPMPQPPNPKATTEEITAFADWVNMGMPANLQGCGGTAGSGGSAGSGGIAGSSGSSGTAGAAGNGGSAGSAGGSTCTPDVSIKASVPWTIKQSVADEYVCFGATIAAIPTKRHITQVSVGIDNTQRTHHICIYDMGTDPVSSIPENCAAGMAMTTGKLLYCWAPGADAQVLPPEAGFPIEANTEANILVEMHYSNIAHEADSDDNSEALLCTTTDVRPNDADVMAFGSFDFSLPPHQQTTVECTLPVQGAALPGGQITVFRGWPHMHLLGAAQSTTVFRNNGAVGDLGSTDSYNFYNQIGYPVDVDIKGGDTIVTTCKFNNTTNNTVSFGENTESEMCFNFVSYYPKITIPGWSWGLPAYSSNCTVGPTAP